MIAGNHIIKSQIFEVSFDHEEEGLAFQKRLSEFIKNELSEITDKCLSYFNTPSIQFINQLELDLGNIAYHNFERILPQIYEEQLMKALSSKLKYEGADSIEEQYSADSALSIIRHFLIKGYMPWNFNEKSWNSFNEIFNHVFENESDAIVNELNQLLKAAPIRKRFINQLDNKTIVQVISKVEPVQAELIVCYHEDWLNIQKTSAIFVSSERELTKSFWHFIFNYLYDERGSYFNTRSFLLSTLHQIVAHFGLSFEVMVILIKESYEKLSVLGRRRELNALLEDIIIQYDTDDVGSHKSQDVKNKAESIYSLDEINHFVKNGVWREGHGISKDKFEQIVEYHLKDKPGEIIRLIKSWTTSQTYIYRLVASISEDCIHGLVQLLEPTNHNEVVLYHANIVSVQHKKTIIQTPSDEFSKIIWMILLSILADNHGSSFNHKSFLKAMIGKMAQRFNLSYEVLLDGLKEGIALFTTETRFQRIIKLVNQIYTEDIFTKDKKIKALSIEDFDAEWIEESVITGRLHLIIQKEGYYQLNDFMKFYSQKDPDHFFRFVKARMKKRDFAMGALRHFSQGTYDELVRIETRKSGINWQATFNVIDQMDSVQILRPRAHQITIRELMLMLVLDTVDKNESTIDKLLITLSGRYGIDFNQLIKSILWVARRSDNKVLFASVLSVANKYQVKDDLHYEQHNEQHMESDKENKSPHFDELVAIISSGFNGIVDRQRFVSYGFGSVDEVLRQLMRQYPQNLKKALAMLKYEDQPFLGIGREIPLSSFYAILSMVDATNGRYLTNLLRTLELKLNQGLQPINRFLSSARSMALVGLTGDAFKLKDFIDDFASLILSMSPSIYIQVIPVLSNKISLLSLPTQGSTQQAISNLEARLSSVIELKSPVDKETLKRMIADEFFDQPLKRESSIISYFEESSDAIYDEIYIENAGLVLIGPYLSTLFERCLLIKDGNFASKEHMEKAVLLIQHALMDEPPLDEHHLPLNKILCGLDVEEPIRADFELKESDLEMIHGLIAAVTNHWSVIKNSSRDGFRGSWLWRKGKLEKKEDAWELRIEQNSYDMLLDQLPFSISPITYSWMKRPLIVNWR